LIALLLSIPKIDVQIEVEEITMKGFCGTVCKKIPRYRKIKDIIINKKQSFEISYNQSLTFLWNTYYCNNDAKINFFLKYSTPISEVTNKISNRSRVYKIIYTRSDWVCSIINIC
jgi:hypothetical protein